MARDDHVPNPDPTRLHAPSRRDSDPDRDALEARREFLRNAAHFGILGAAGIFLINDVSRGALRDPLSPVQPAVDSACSSQCGCFCNCGCGCDCTTCTCACNCSCQCACDCGCECECGCTCSCPCTDCECGCACLCTCQCQCQCDVQPLAGAAIGLQAPNIATQDAAVRTPADAGRTATQQQSRQVSSGAYDIQKDTLSRHQGNAQSDDTGGYSGEKADLTDNNDNSSSGSDHQQTAGAERDKSVAYSKDFLFNNRKQQGRGGDLEGDDAFEQAEAPGGAPLSVGLLKVTGAGARRLVRFCA